MADCRCPRCGSTTLNRTAISYVKRTVSGTIGLAAGFTAGAAGTLFTMGKAADWISRQVATNLVKPITDIAYKEYECKRCGHIFKVKPE